MESYTRIVPRPVDIAFFRDYLDSFLPAQLFDSHVHVWESIHRQPGCYLQRGEDWAERIERENTFEALCSDYERLLPDRNVRGLLFGWVGADINVAENNRYIGEIIHDHPGWYGLAVSCPNWNARETVDQVEGNGLRGLKPYITFAASTIPTPEITIYDILSREQLTVADEREYVCVIHLPRPGRLPDSENLRQLLEIECDFPNARIIVAHIGRCYSTQDLRDAFERLKATKNMCFDFSGNTNAEVIRRALETFGPERILFGSDLPLTHIHMKRVYNEVGHYINLIDPSERPQINEAAYTQPMPDADIYTFYLYESLYAFREAAQALKLSPAEISHVLHDNALRLLEH